MAASTEEQVSLRTWIAVLGTVLGAFMAVLDIQITNASLREITGGIASTAVEASWVSTSLPNAPSFGSNELVCHGV